MDIKNITSEINTPDHRELPLYFPPPIYYSLYAAVRLSILLSSPKTHDWFYSNFIQLHFEDTVSANPKSPDHNLNIFPVEYMKSWYYTGAALFLQEKLINDKIVKIDEKTLLPMMIDWLGPDRFYVISRVDVSKISGTRHFGKEPKAHTVVFYGCDLQKRVFKHIDFNEKGDLVQLDVTFEDYQAAFFSHNLAELLRTKKINSGFHISLCNIKSSVNYQLDTAGIKSLLLDYLHSVNTTQRFNLFIPESKGVFGLSIYDAVSDFTESMADKNHKIDYRVFHALYEHKKIMVSRLRHLETLGIVDSSRQLAEKFGKIEELTHRLRLKALRYSVTQDEQIIEGISAALKNIREQEKPLIEEIISCL